MTSVDKRPLKVFPSTGSGHRLCHAHADRNAVRTHYTRLTTPPRRVGAGEDGVDRSAWLDKEKLLPGQDWELAIRKAVREISLLKAL